MLPAQRGAPKASFRGGAVPGARRRAVRPGKGPAQPSTALPSAGIWTDLGQKGQDTSHSHISAACSVPGEAAPGCAGSTGLGSGAQLPPGVGGTDRFGLGTAVGRNPKSEPSPPREWGVGHALRAHELCILGGLCPSGMLLHGFFQRDLTIYQILHPHPGAGAGASRAADNGSCLPASSADTVALWAASGPAIWLVSSQ